MRPLCLVLCGCLKVEAEDIITLDHRLASVFNGAMLLLAEFLLLNNDDAENTNKLRRAYSTTDGGLFTTVLTFMNRSVVDLWKSFRNFDAVMIYLKNV